jgi:DNA-binding NarL/FixJ family response regulator
MAAVSAPVRVLIVDDDALVRAGLTMMLGGAEDIVVVGEASDGDAVAAAADAHAPDVVLMDIRMPRLDGITATARLRRRQHPPEVIVLTTFDADELVLRALRVGASGFLLKDTPPAQIVDAIRRVAAGDPILSSRITRRLIDMVAADDGTRELPDVLSPRLAAASVMSFSASHRAGRMPSLPPHCTSALPRSKPMSPTSSAS